MQNFELKDLAEVLVKLNNGKVITFKGYGLNKLRRIFLESPEIPKAVIPEVIDYDDEEDGGNLLFEDEEFEEEMLPRQRKLRSQKHAPQTFITTPKGSYRSSGIDYAPQTGSIADIAKAMQSSSGLSFTN